MRVNKKHAIVALALGSTILFGAGACDDDEPTAAQKAASDRNKGVEQIRKEQPVEPMQYSPTLNTINKWAKIWGSKDSLAYVYMKPAGSPTGVYDGYYVFEGPPVNMCVGGSPPYDLHDVSGDRMGPNMTLPAPGLDGAYYGGCDASRYYGIDAVTGQILEYTDGFILTAVVSNQPLPLEKQPPAYVSSIEDVKNKKN